MNRRDEVKLFNRVFSSEDGQKMLQILNERFVYNTETDPKAANIEFSAGYAEGQRGTIKWINRTLADSQNLKD